MSNKIPEFGAIYNKLSVNGLPVLGSWVQASGELDPTDNGFYPNNDPQFIPRAGASIIDRVYAKLPGEVSFNARMSGNFPALVFAEDLLCVNILMLLNDEPQWPAFHLFQPHENKSSLEKIWYPEWLAHTEIGRTLYACHYLIDALVFEPESFDFAEKEDFIAPKLYTESLRFWNTLKRLKRDYQPNRYDHEVSIKVLAIHMDPQENPLLEIYIRGVNIGFEVISKSKLKQTRIEPIHTYLNNRKHLLSLLLPTFERLGQINALIYAILQLKKMGYVMPKDIEETHKNLLHNFLQRLEEDERKNNKLL